MSVFKITCQGEKISVTFVNLLRVTLLQALMIKKLYNDSSVLTEYFICLTKTLFWFEEWNLFMKMRKIKSHWWRIFKSLLRKSLFQHQHLRQVKMFVFVFISSFVSIRVRIYVQHFFDAVGNKISDIKSYHVNMH